MLPPIQDEKHGRFLERLRGSTPAVFAVAAHLHERGYDLMIPAKRYTPSVEQHMDYVDDGDIKIRKGDGEWERIEVKGIETQFTSLADWPHKFVVVNSKKAVDRADPFPRAWFIVSLDLEHCIIVRGNTRDQWVERELKPKNTGVKEMFYIVANEVPKFIKL